MLGEGVLNLRDDSTVREMVAAIVREMQRQRAYGCEFDINGELAGRPMRLAFKVQLLPRSHS